MAEQDWTGWSVITQYANLNFGEPGVTPPYLMGDVPIQSFPLSDFTVYVMGREGKASAVSSWVKLEPQGAVPWLEGPTIAIPLDELGDNPIVEEFSYEYAAHARFPRWMTFASVGLMIAPVNLETGEIGPRRAAVRVTRAEAGSMIRMEGLGDSDAPFAETEVPYANSYFDACIVRSHHEGYAQLRANESFSSPEGPNDVGLVSNGVIQAGEDDPAMRLCLIFTSSSTGGYENFDFPLITVWRRTNFNSGEEEPEEPEEPIDPPALSVSNLKARTHCVGRRIDLSWTNPDGAMWMYIARRQKNWIFDLDDPHDIVYVGEPIESFVDTGMIGPIIHSSGLTLAGSEFIYVDSFEPSFVGSEVRIEQLNGKYQYETRTVTNVVYQEISVRMDLDEPLEGEYQPGARVGRVSGQLDEQTYYYYTVLVSPWAEDAEIGDGGYMPVEPHYTFTDDSHVIGLSIAEMNSKDDFFWRNTPEYYREKDEEEAGGYLDKWYDVFGCWLNILRGHAKAMVLLNNDDASPYHTLSAKNLSLGIEPEGFSYDYEIPRRTILSLANVYKRRGTCEGMIRAVRLFTKWEAVCAEFTLGGCANGVRSLSTWDGHSEAYERVDYYNIVQEYDAELKSRILRDDGTSYEDHRWKHGMVVGPLGDIVCVADNVNSRLQLKDPTRTHRIRQVTGVDTLELTSLNGLTAGMFVQLESRTNPIQAEIVQIDYLQPPYGVKTVEPLVGGYVRNDYVSVGKNIVRFEQIFTGTILVDQIDATETEPAYTRLYHWRGGWVENQWRGYQVFVGDQARPILKNDDYAVYVAQDLALEVPERMAIAKEYLGGTWADRQPLRTYKVYNGNHSFLFNPVYNLPLRGTRYDPFNRLWQGIGSTLLGAWGGADVGVYITTPVCQYLGRAGSANEDVMYLDPEQPVPASGSLVGMFLNPNQNQNRLFRIVENDASSITVDDDISDLVVPGVPFYVLKPRDANRYRALVNRLTAPLREFANMDIDVRILFAPIDVELPA